MKDLFIILFFYSFFICNIYSLDLEKIRAEILENHNYHRKRHQVDILVRNAEIEAVAQAYSDHLAEIDEMKHSGNKYMEKIYFIVGLVEEYVLVERHLHKVGMMKLKIMIIIIQGLQ